MHAQPPLSSSLNSSGSQAVQLKFELLRSLIVRMKVLRVTSASGRYRDAIPALI